MWQDFAGAGRTSDWRAPELGEHATGIALTSLSRALYADHVNGLVTRGTPALSPVVSSVEPSGDPVRIVLSDCGDTTGWAKYRVSTEQLADGAPGGRQAVRAVVGRQADGSWKVTDFAVRGVGSC